MLLVSCAFDVWKMGEWQCYRVLFCGYGVLLCLVGNSALCLIMSDSNTLFALCVLYIMRIKKLELDFLDICNKKVSKEGKCKLLSPV